jgi:Mg-chelatase subunit ChlD
MRFASTILLLAALSDAWAQSPAKIIGFSDHGDKRDDKIGFLSVACNVEVQVPGVYWLRLSLTAPRGGVLNGRAEAKLERGAQVLRASWIAFEVVDNLAEDGPYRIVDAQLYFRNETGGNTFVEGVKDAGLTAPYLLTDMYRDPFNFTGNVSFQPIPNTPGGKFGELTFSFGVVSPGGVCSASGELLDENGIRMSYYESLEFPIRAGKSFQTLNFLAYKVAGRTADGPLIVTNLTLACHRGQEPVEKLVDDTKHRSQNFRSSDFEGAKPDFQFAPAEHPGFGVAGSVATLWVTLKPTGVALSRLDLVAEADDPKIKFALPGGRPCSLAPSCWEGVLPVTGYPTSGTSTLGRLDEYKFLAGLRIQIDAKLAPATYPIRLIARLDNIERRADLELIVNTELTKRKQAQDETLAALVAEDPLETSPTRKAPAAAPPRESYHFSAEVSLKKIHAMIVLDHSYSMQRACPSLRAAAIRFSRLFVDGRDSLGVISYGDKIDLDPLTDHFQGVSERISEIKCEGNTNTIGALQMAERELVQHADPNAINTVILFTDGQPDVLTANWPLSPKATCKESKVSTTVLGSLSWGLDVRSPLLPQLAWFYAIGKESAVTSASYGSCLEPTPIAPSNISNFAYMPDQDLHGFSFSGSHPLERLATGDNAGKIRIDSAQNLVNAANNQVENAIDQMRSGSNPTSLYLIGFDNGAAGEPIPPIDYLRKLTNDPQSSSFDPGLPAGLAIVTKRAEDFWNAFLRVRQDIVTRATIH